MLIKSKIDRAWLAAVLDTDGSIYIRTYNNNGILRSYTMAMLYNSNLELLEKAKTIVTGNIHFHYREGTDSRGIKRGNNYTFTFSRKILKQALQNSCLF